MKKLNFEKQAQRFFSAMKDYERLTTPVKTLESFSRIGRIEKKYFAELPKSTKL